MPNAAAATVMGQTGSTCSQSGPYRSNRAAKVVIFVREGTTFPSDSDGLPTTWVLVSADAAQ
jgi:hypothetical protein